MFLSLIGLVFSSQYAVLYAGSNTYYNYRHQADIFTIYNQLLVRGFTASNIGLYAYDDIATVPENPFTGQIFHSIDHKVNVYPGSAAINVKGKNVSAQAFYDSISKLPTTSNDYVFIYYDNHGGQGILGTPLDAQYIKAPELSESFSTASASNLFKKCLFIIEACYSGSVAETFTAPNLATITAANNQESSWAAVYDEEVGTYLSNEFTNYFISYIDENPSTTVGELFEYLKQKTEQSHVCYYGDESVKSIPLSTFIGKPNKVLTKSVKKADLKAVKPREATEKTLMFLSKHSKASIRARARLHLLSLKAQTEKLDAVLEMLVKYVDPKNYEKIMNDKQSKPTQTYFDVLTIFTQKFGKINSDDFDRLSILCSLSSTHSKAEIVQGIFAILF